MEQKNIQIKESPYACHQIDGKIPVIVYGSCAGNVCKYCDRNLFDDGFDKLPTIHGGDIESVTDQLEKYLGAYLCPSGDAFSPRNRETTHNLLKRIFEKTKRFVPSIITKNTPLEETYKLLAENKERVILGYSLPSYDERFIKEIEPSSAIIHERLETMRRLSHSGIKVIWHAMPLVYLKREDIEKLVELVATTGVKKAIMSPLAIPNQKRDYFVNHHLPELRDFARACTEFKQLGTRKAWVLPLEELIQMSEEFSEISDNFGIKTEICAATLNPRLIGATHNLSLCTQIKHKNFKK
ncbi:MAG: hypothetical protein NTX24_02280 [Candidatus Pacearchaeota archaeon]|nr:hypothetical protein [Candidatus Pacearchaeota archaeon]